MNEKEEGTREEGTRVERITVYSKPSCVQCTATYRALDKAGIPYDLIDLGTSSDAVLEYVKELGYMQAPVVVVTDQDHWSGFCPDNITRIANFYGPSA